MTSIPVTPPARTGSDDGPPPTDLSRRRVDEDTTTVWTLWQVRQSEQLALLLAGAGEAAGVVRLVVCAQDAGAAEDAGRSIAASLERSGRDPAAWPNVFVTQDPPTRRDLEQGRHLVLGGPMPVAPDIRTEPVPDDLPALVSALAAATSVTSRGEGLPPAAETVAVHLMGGLGNQMFQYAVARATADRLGAALVMDLRWFAIQRKNQFELLDLRVRWDGLVTTDEEWVSSDYQYLHRFEEASFSYDSRVSELRPGTALIGYFQSPQYFQDAWEELRGDFELVSTMTPWGLSVRESMRAVERPVSLHVRRGDYVTQPDVNAFHGSTSSAYYRQALATLQDLEPELDVFTFSDEPAWAREHIAPSEVRSSAVIYPPPSSRASESIHLLAEAHHSVIANSSFSWWGAWLRRRPGVTFAPRPWFLAATDTRDLLPAHWMTLDGR